MDFGAVSRLLELARGLDIPVIVVFIPSVPPSAHAPLWPRFSVLVDDALDLREQLRNEKYFMDAVHLNPSGHAYVGDVIAGEIDSRVSGSISKCPPTRASLGHDQIRLAAVWNGSRIRVTANFTTAGREESVSIR